MDWENGNAEIHKKNSKFESFLKRALSEELFHRVRAYESCIVVSENENKTFKFAVLTDELLYLTENPPKVLQQVLHLRDVVSVELVNEYPDFLTGEERTHTQHIAITYMTSEPRRRAFRRTKRSPRGSQTELSETRSNASTPVSYASSLDGNVIEDSSSLTHSTISINGSQSWGSLKTGITKKKKKAGLNDSLEHGSILRSLKEEMEEDVTEHSQLNPVISPLQSRRSPVQSSRSLYTIHSSARLKSRNALVPSENGRQVKDSIESARMLADNGFSGQISTNKLPPIQVTKPYISENGKQTSIDLSTKDEVQIVDIKGCCSYFRNYRKPKNQVRPVHNSSDHQLELPQLTTSKVNGLPAIHSELYVGSPLLTKNAGLDSRTSLIKDSRSATPLLGSQSNINELNNSFSDWGNTSSLIGFSLLSLAGGGMERRKCVLNIYLLNLESPFLFFVKSAWNNYVIKSTLALEPGELLISTERTSLSLTRRDTIERKYSQIKRDLLQRHLPLEEKYDLIDQLCSATKSNNVLKRFFWKNPDMLSFFIGQLHKYLPTSSAALNTDKGKFQRTDEIEFAILVLSAINLMLRETEVLPGRMQILKLEGGRFICDLLKILTTQPDFLCQPVALTKHWTLPAAENRKLHADRSVDEELARLKAEYIHMSINSVFELILVAKQAPAGDDSALSVSGIISMFLHMKAMETFVDCLLSQIMDLINLSKFDLLTPIQALLVFQIFSLLLTFLQQSSLVLGHIRNNYYEEFKYFIQVPAVSRKLPVHYPITPIIVSLIDQVVVRVLGTPTLHSARDL